MIENLNIYIVVIIILIMVIIYTNLNQIKIYDKLIGGFYEADASFCIESGIESFCMFLDDKAIDCNSRACYLLMKSGDSLLINEPTTAKLTQHWSWASHPSKPQHFTIEFADISDEVNEFFPNIQNVKFYPTIGKLVLYVDDTVYATLYKNGFNSEVKDLDDDDDEDDYDEKE